MGNWGEGGNFFALKHASRSAGSKRGSKAEAGIKPGHRTLFLALSAINLTL